MQPTESVLAHQSFDSPRCSDLLCRLHGRSDRSLNGLQRYHGYQLVPQLAATAGKPGASARTSPSADLADARFSPLLCPGVRTIRADFGTAAVLSLGHKALYTN